MYWKEVGGGRWGEGLVNIIVRIINVEGFGFYFKDG